MTRPTLRRELRDKINEIVNDADMADRIADAVLSVSGIANSPRARALADLTESEVEQANRKLDAILEQTIYSPIEKKQRRLLALESLFMVHLTINVATSRWKDALDFMDRKCVADKRDPLVFVTWLKGEYEPKFISPNVVMEQWERAFSVPNAKPESTSVSVSSDGIPDTY